MNPKIDGKICLVKKGKKGKRARIIRSFLQVGGDGHGEEFVSLILDDPTLNMWDRDIVCKLSDVKLLD